MNFVALLLVLTSIPPATTHPSDAVLGRWFGTSICVKTAANSACHDEVVRYNFVRDSVRHDVIVNHADKQVGNDWEWMGDIEVRWDSAGNRWAGEWQNSRTHIEWSFWLVGPELHGMVVRLPGREKGRDVVAHR